MNHAEQVYLKPPVAEPPKKSLQDMTLEDLSLEKQAAISGNLTDRQKDDIVKNLAEKSRAELYGVDSMEDVVDTDFDSLSGDEQMAMFDKAQADAEARLNTSESSPEEVALKQVDRANEILALDPERLKFARDTIRTYREKLKVAEVSAQESFERIQKLQAQHAQAVESNSPDAEKIDAQLSAEVTHNEALDATVKRHEKFVAMAEVAFEKAFNIPAGSTSKE